MSFKFLGEPLASRFLGHPLGTPQQAGGVLPVEIDFSVLGDGALPSPFTAPNWAVSSGAAVGTPTGSSVLTNGDFESWSSATDADNWTETVAGTSSVNRDGADQHGGTFCCRFDVDAGNDNVEVNQTPSIDLADWFTTKWWLKANAGGTSGQMFHKNQYPASYAMSLTTSYQQFEIASIKRIAAGFSVGYGRLSAASQSQFMDDVTTIKHNLSSLLATFNAGASDVTLRAGWTLPALPESPLAGVIMCADSLTNPTNYVAYVVNGPRANSYLFKVVGTTVTQVATQAVVYSDGDYVELRKTGTTFQMYYNGAQVGANQTIADAEIVSNTIHGMFSTSASSSCDYFFAG